MSVSLTFPGVFIEEIPSGVRSITGVPTAIAAFVGRTRIGPVNTPVIINSFGDFTRSFGGLDVNSSVSYAVRDFFQNGGGQGIVVRIFNDLDSTKSPPVTAPHNGVATITITSGATSIVLRAVSPGDWANDLTVKITVLDSTFGVNNGPPPTAKNAQLASVATALGLDNSDVPTYTNNLKQIFDLTISSGGASEIIRNVTASPSNRPLSQVLKPGSSESQFLIWEPADNTTPITSFDISGLVGKSFTVAANGTPGTASAVLVQAGAELNNSESAPVYGTDATTKDGLFALEGADIFNILCIPPDTRDPADGISWLDTPDSVFAKALQYVVTRRAMLVVDPPTAMETAADGLTTLNDLATNGITGDAARNAVMYFPRVDEIDPLKGNKIGTFVSAGIVAGIMSRTDAARGVWKAPAGIDAGITGTTGLAVSLTDAENGEINPIGINALRNFPIVGSVVWGARTLRGADSLADDYKYLPVRRFALFLEESLFRGLKFAVFEPNDEPLWSQIRLNVGAFLNNLFRQGAFQGRTPRDAYFVKCDSDTTTQNDINLGVVNVLVGFAPLKPAEFVVIKIQQIAGQVTT